MWVRREREKKGRKGGDNKRPDTDVRDNQPLRYLKVCDEAHPVRG